MNDRNTPGTPWHKALGCVADDLTGATDLASVISRSGISVRICFGNPRLAELKASQPADVVIVALQVRSGPSASARDVVHATLQTLLDLGITRYYDKYCSTFDSTDAGNIGPIADEILAITGAAQCLHAPSYPENGRTVYQGVLFVGSQLLQDSPMRDHPRNPMRESDLPVLLRRQTAARVGQLSWQSLRTGAARSDLAFAAQAGVRHVIADALTDQDLDLLATAMGNCLPAGGAAFGAAVARAMVGENHRSVPSVPSEWHGEPGKRAVIVGSGSARTREQVAHFAGRVVRLTSDEAMRGGAAVSRVAAEAQALLAAGPVLVAAAGAGVDERGGTPTESSALAMERALGLIARQLVDGGVRSLIVAGGETSGAVAAALGLTSVAVGPEIAPGVPWTFSTSPPLALAFKSGNFGGPDFFGDAFQVLQDALASQ